MKLKKWNHFFNVIKNNQILGIEGQLFYELLSITLKSSYKYKSTF